MTSLPHRLVGAALDGANGAVARFARLRPDRPYARGRYRITRDVRYGDRPDQRLDVYAPLRLPGARPLALYLHGGGFRVLSKDTHGFMAGQLAGAGWTVVCPDYRLAPRHPFPAALEDATAALMWSLDRAADLGADPDRLLLVGESAGGCLSTALALAACFERPEPFARTIFERAPRIDAVAPLCPFLHVAGRAPTPREASMPGFVRARVAQLVDGYAGHVSGDAAFFASPIVPLESDRAPDRPLPPFFASCGSDDVIVEDTRRLERALARRGVDHEVRYYTGQGHAFQARFWTPQGRRSWEDLIAFVRTRGRASAAAGAGGRARTSASAPDTAR
ncbi:MAG: alpha/beta hydrolase [Sandaracinaceae bacterium]|nr:alpha/beta hydrolase [Sandaracinaceae bacterium]